ncbi:L,D-transpeptidase [Streptomyces sp. NPDC093225]|uniref:L,D-transpeptidase n=1 Tax=Streptomyces sp. NPDC093225 TaxID=3366034 RepID=UPI003820C5DD
MTLIGLQRSAGNRAVATMLARGGRDRLTVQRCGPTRCDCSPEDQTAAESSTVVSRSAEGIIAAAEEAAGTAAAVGEVDEESFAHDGDTPPGGPILPVPESPDELTSPESLLADDGSERRPGVSLIVARDRAHESAPTSRRRWIVRIAIDLAGQTISYEWSDGAPGGRSSISSGRGRPCTANDPCANQNNRNCTPTGTFHPDFLGGSEYTNSEGDAMAWYVDLGTGRGVGIHDSQPVLGRPASHGCVRVPMSMARIINQNVIRRTEIVISGKAATIPWRDRTCRNRRR